MSRIVRKENKGQGIGGRVLFRVSCFANRKIHGLHRSDDPRPATRETLFPLSLFAVRRPLIIAAAIMLSGCVLPTVDQTVPPVPVTVPGADVSTYLEVMEQIGSSNPAQQTDLFLEVERAFTATPTTTNSLRYALVLIMPGHPATDAVEGRKVLETLLASPERLLASERKLAAVFLQETEARLKLEAETRRLLETVDERTRAQANSDRRAQTQAEENARLRKALEEAQAKLDAIRDIERSIIERNPSPTGAPGSRSESPVEAQSTPPGR